MVKDVASRAQRFRDATQQARNPYFFRKLNPKCSTDVEVRSWLLRVPDMPLTLTRKVVKGELAKFAALSSSC